MPRAILVDFDTEMTRDFAAIRPIGVLLERADLPGFDSLYLETVTEDTDDTGHDNYERTMRVTEEFRRMWDNGEESAGRVASVRELFTYLADASYLGVRFRSLGNVEDGVTLEEAFQTYVVEALPLVSASDEEFPSA